jgi:hypothetical protein
MPQARSALARNELLNGIFPRRLAGCAHCGGDVVQGVIHGIMWLNPVEFEVSVIDGVVDISGVIERRSHVEILIDLIRGVEGVVAVRPAVGYRLDDRNLAVSIGVPPY